MRIKERLYLLSMNKDSVGNATIDYIKIYYFNIHNEFVFVNMIDRSFVDIEDSFDLTDLLVIDSDNIILAEKQSKSILSFSYSLANEIILESVKKLSSTPLSLVYSQSKTLFVATSAVITEYANAQLTEEVTRYEVDPQDDHLTSLQVS